MLEKHHSSPGEDVKTTTSISTLGDGIKVIKFECMSVIAHNGTYDNIVDSFHVKILHERSLHEKIVEYIID